MKFDYSTSYLKVTNYTRRVVLTILCLIHFGLFDTVFKTVDVQLVR